MLKVFIKTSKKTTKLLRMPRPTNPTGPRTLAPPRAEANKSRSLTPPRHRPPIPTKTEQYKVSFSYKTSLVRSVKSHFVIMCSVYVCRTKVACDLLHIRVAELCFNFPSPR